MSTETLRLYLSVLDVRLELHDAPVAAHVLRTIWAAAASPMVPSRAESRYEVRRVPEGYELRNLRGGSCIVRNPDDLAPTIEQTIYADVVFEHENLGLTLLHAAAFADGERTFLVLGESGAGKSALARAAVEAGLSYLGDEHVATDGELVFGLPRAIHLDVVPADAAPLPWHEGADCETYRFPDAHGRRMVVPFVPVDASRVSPPRRLERAELVRARRGDDDRVGPLELHDALALIERCTLVASVPGSIGLARLARRHDLVWHDPGRALVKLRAAEG